MLGIFEGFPERIHRMVLLQNSVTDKKLQSALASTLTKLNKSKLDFPDLSMENDLHSETICEFGIGEGNDFTYLDAEEIEKLKNLIATKPLRVMDLLLVLRYYKVDIQKRSPLRFDYYMLRLVFEAGTVEVRVFHQKGPMRVSPKNVVDLVVEQTNRLASKKMLSLQ